MENKKHIEKEAKRSYTLFKGLINASEEQENAKKTSSTRAKLVSKTT
ncbi:MAG: hypothetical protein PWQ28_753 [Candidatus Woesearchaeota archaeon]|nr:hypothetical protein [Candidatus Woesearchaeota archaeon]